MSGQLIGVLREVVAQDTGVPGPGCRRSSARSSRDVRGKPAGRAHRRVPGRPGAFGEADRQGDRHRAAGAAGRSDRRRRPGAAGDGVVPAGADAGFAARGPSRRTGRRGHRLVGVGRAAADGGAGVAGPRRRGQGHPQARRPGRAGGLALAAGLVPGGRRAADRRLRLRHQAFHRGAGHLPRRVGAQDGAGRHRRTGRQLR